MLRHTLSLLILLLATLLSLGSSELKWRQFPFLYSPYLLGTDHARKSQFYCCVAQTTQKKSHVLTISPVHCLADCCLATSYKHSSYCWVRVLRSVYRAVAWQCVDMSEYIIFNFHIHTMHEDLQYILIYSVCDVCMYVYSRGGPQPAPAPRSVCDTAHCQEERSIGFDLQFCRISVSQSFNEPYFRDPL
jgi:hypothetical protein